MATPTSEFYLLEHHVSRNKPREEGSGRPWYPNRLNEIQIGVLHTAENLPDFAPPDMGAEAVAKYGSGTERASWHDTVDSDSWIRMLPHSHTAFHVIGYNSRAVGLEMATQAALWVSTGMGWRLAMLENAARWVADVSIRHHLPIRLLTKAEVDAGQKGFTFHSRLDPTRRSDPGQSFPWSHVEKRAKAIAANNITFGTPVIAASVASVEQALAFTLAGNPGYTPDVISRIVQETYRLEPIEGVRADMAVALMRKETGNFRFLTASGQPGLVRPEQWNFGGIGATGKGFPGQSYPDAEAGVHAVVRRMRMYAEGTQALHDIAILGRSLDQVHWGRYPNIEDFNGVWAVPGDGYGESIVNIMTLMADVPVPMYVDRDQWSLWAQADIETMIETGIMRGDGNTHEKTFRPKDAVTREELAVSLARLRRELMND